MWRWAHTQQWTPHLCLHRLSWMLESITKTPSFRPFKVSVVNMPSPHLFRSKSPLCWFLRLFCIFPYYNINLSIHLVVCLSVYLHFQVHRTLELFNYLSFLNLRAAQGWAPWAADLRIGRNDYHIREKGEIRQGGEGRERTERREGLLLPRTAVILYTEHPAPFCWHLHPCGYSGTGTLKTQLEPTSQSPRGEWVSQAGQFCVLSSGEES